MKTPLKIAEYQSTEDTIQVKFAFPWEEKAKFKEQLKLFWLKFNERGDRINSIFMDLTAHIQSATAEVSKIRPYTEKKVELLNQINEEVSNFISLHEDDKKISLVDIPKNIRQDIRTLLINFEESSNRLKSAYKYESLYLNEMIQSFDEIRKIASLIFEKYEFMSAKIENFNENYFATLRVVFGKHFDVEEIIFKPHADLKQLEYNSNVLNFISNCLTLLIKKEFDELEGMAKDSFDSALFNADFIKNFEKQTMVVSEYIEKYKDVIKIQQQLLDMTDYRQSVYSKSAYFEEKNKIINKDLLDLWKKFNEQYQKIFTAISNYEVREKIKKQILPIQIKDFFHLNGSALLAQALTDVDVDDFSESCSLLTWEYLNKENSLYCKKVKKIFFEAYADKYKLEQLSPGIFFRQKNEIYQLCFLTFDNEYNVQLQNFIQRLENKYQKKFDKIKSVRSSNLGDIVELTYRNAKVYVPVGYMIFEFKDATLLQNFKNLQEI